ncbi:MAG: chalcone isomerase family protein [Thiogranum sp.]
MLLSPPMQHDVLNSAGTHLPGGTGVMAIFFRYTFYISLLLAPLLAHAETKIADIELADSYQVGQQSLLLNGAGIRSKLFIKIYVGALYLVKTSKSPEDILAATDAKSMQMTMLYKEVEAEKITQGWDDGFKANLTKSELKSLEGRLKKFNALFPALRAGDIVRMDYLPDTGTRLSINDKQLGGIEGADFFTALLKVWIGEHPADKNLKKGLLGG